MTRRLHQASGLIGIPLLDHVVVTPGSAYSITANKSL
jgi:DNA repair protein RadC